MWWTIWGGWLGRNSETWCPMPIITPLMNCIFLTGMLLDGIMKMGEDSIEETRKMCCVCLLSFVIHCADLHLIQELEGKVSISLNAWTSSNNIAFLAIVATTSQMKASMVCVWCENVDRLYAGYYERGATDWFFVSLLASILVRIWPKQFGRCFMLYALHER